MISSCEGIVLGVLTGVALGLWGLLAWGWIQDWRHGRKNRAVK